MDVDVTAEAIKFRILLWLVALCANIDRSTLTAQGHEDRSVRNQYFNYTDIGPVQELSYRIANVTILAATWRQPHTIENIAAYALECAEQQHQSTKKVKILPESEIVEASLDLEDQVAAFECSVRAFSEHHDGTAVLFNVTTLGLHPVTNLSFVGGCDGSLQATWSYTHKNEAGFNLTICRQPGEKCNTTLVRKNVRHCKFSAEELDVQYQLSVSAIGKILGVNVLSQDVMANATSFPRVPLLADVVVEGTSPEALTATWQTNWTHEIHFSICSRNDPGQYCQNYNVSGALRQVNFTGLLPQTTYDVKSNGQATYGNRTCVGPETEQTASTYSLHPGPVCNLEYEIDNVTRLVASWNGPVASVPYDGYALQCTEKKFGAVKSTETLQAEKHANITLDLEEQLAEFFCEVWAFAYNGTARNNGTTDTFSVKTNGIGPPKHVTLIERTAMSLAYSWAKDRNAPKCRVVVVATGASDVIQDDCISMGDEEIVRDNITGLTPGRGYNVSIQNCAEYCGIATVIDDHTNVAAPSVVTNFTASVTGFVNVTFTWEKPAVPNGPIDGYLIRIVNENNNVTTEILADGLSTDATIVVGSEFTYFRCSITAYNVRKPEGEKIFGPETSTSFESLGSGPFPPHPTVRDIQETDAVVYWEKAEDPRYNIASYKVYVETKGSFATTHTKLNISHLNPWTRYVVSVSSCAQEIGCGEERSISFRTDVAAPSKPLWLTAPSVSFEWIYLEWERPDVPNGPIDGYNVSLTGKNVSFQAVTTALSYNVSQLRPGTLYSVSVYAFNYGFNNEKRGPGAILAASTSSVAKGTHVLFLVMGVAMFAITTSAVAAFCLWPHVASGIGKTPPTEQDETELHTIKPWLRIRRKLCPSGVFGEDNEENLVD
ncbi:hypothetical protein MRX96_040253 [Rhipicephalus microplus]